MSLRNVLLAATVALAGCAGLARPPERVEVDVPAVLGEREAATEALVEHNAALRGERDYTRPVTRRPTDPEAGRLEAWQLDPAVAGQEAGRAGTAPGSHAGGGPRFRVDMDFREVSILEFIRTLFKEYLDAPYTVAGDFKDRQINVVYHGEATRAELFTLLESLLQFHGVYLKLSNGLYTIGESSSKPLPSAARARFGYTTGMFKLNHITAGDFLIVVRQFLSNPTLAKPIEATNTVVVSAPAPEVDAIRALRTSLDVPFFEGKHIILYTPRYLSAAALKALLDKYVSLLGSKAKGFVKQIEAAELPVQNRLVVVAYNRAAKDLITEFIAHTDTARANRRQTFQYPLSSQKAPEIGTSIKQLAAAMFGKETPIDVVADKGSNSLFIVATPEQFAELSKLIQRMDYRPPAAYIDVTVLEVNLNDSLRYGVEWFLNHSGSRVLSDVTVNLGAGLTRGLDLGVVSATSNKFLALQLLANQTDFTILSNPHVIVKNGALARINIGREIAIASATLQTDTSGSSTQTNFARRDVSITLEVTPDIRADGTILLTFKLKDERDAGVDANTPPQPVFNKRELVTELVTHDGQTLFIGGILQRSEQRNVSKIPLLGDVPYLGKLFSASQDEGVRTELVMFVTPTLILDGVGTALLNRAILSLSERLGGRREAESAGGV